MTRTAMDQHQVGGEASVSRQNAPATHPGRRFQLFPKVSYCELLLKLKPNNLGKVHTSDIPSLPSSLGLRMVSRFSTQSHVSTTTAPDMFNKNKPPNKLSQSPGARARAAEVIIGPAADAIDATVFPTPARVPL